MGGDPLARTLNPEELRKPCDPKRFRFVTTAEVASLPRIVGQSRALDAIDFGLGMRSLGFNIYVLGESGTGEYPPGTLYRRVMDRIGELREAVKGQENEEEGGKKERTE
jgi:hypothetical protein